MKYSRGEDLERVIGLLSHSSYSIELQIQNSNKEIAKNIQG